MSFDDNPFAEPTIDNPFTDIAIQEIVTKSNTRIQVDDYNPFENQPNSYNQPVAKQKPMLSTIELQRKQEELERKEQELAKREEEMRNNLYNVRRNNWPPLPDQCYFQPCFYQDIQLDIPLEFQPIVQNLYYLWLFHATILIINVIGGIIILNFTIIGLGIMFVLMFIPFSYLCWFRPAYKAFKSDSSINFMMFFCVFFFQFCITTIQTIGIPGSGTVGIITALKQFDDSVHGMFIGTFSLSIAIGFGCAAAADLFLISKIHRMYRSSGASFAKAQAEFFENSPVGTTTTNVAAAALQSLIYQTANRQ